MAFVLCCAIGAIIIAKFIELFVDGDFAKEEDKECWVV